MTAKQITKQEDHQDIEGKLHLSIFTLFLSKCFENAYCKKVYPTRPWLHVLILRHCNYKQNVLLFTLDSVILSTYKK